MITIVIDICIAISGMFFGMALFSKIMREKNEAYKNALEKIKERVQSSLNKADSYVILKINSYVILKIINEVLDKNNEEK